jgi:hypothetical protein
VSLWRNLLILTALPGLAAAADPDMLNLVMPDASMVMEINLARIMASPAGSAMQDAFHRGLETGLNGQLAKTKPQFAEQIALLGNIDWSRDVQDVLMASGPGKHPAALIIVRSSIDLARIQALKAFSETATEYEGVPVLTSSKPGSAAIAFLDGSIVLAGQMSDVQAAIHRRGQHTALPKALTTQVAKYSRDDIWVAATDFPADPLSGPLATKSPEGVKMAEFVGKVAGFNGGLRLSPDFDLSFDLETRTEKGAAEIFNGLRSLVGMMQSQVKNASMGDHGLEGLQYQMNGRHILLSLHVPEAQMRAGIEQIRAAQAHQTAAAVRQTKAAVREAQPVPAPSSGLPPPPAGTIRVQSSDMGTVLIQVGKPQ